MKTITAKLLVLLLLIIASNTWAQSNILEIFDEGVQLLKTKQYAGATEQFTKALKIAKSKRVLKMTYIYRGLALRGQGKFQEAITDIGEAIQLDSSDAASYIDRGKVYLDLKKTALAIKDFQQVLTIDEQGAQGQAAYYYLGWVYLQQKQFKKAIPYFDRLLELAPRDAEVYYFRGIAMARLKQFEQAIASFDMVIQYKPTRKAYAMRGRAKLDLHLSKDIQLVDEKDIIEQCITFACKDLIKAKKLGDTSLEKLLAKYCNGCK